MSGTTVQPVDPIRPPDHHRQSHGLEQLFTALDPLTHKQVLDLGEFTQTNVANIVNLGHRLTFEDLLRTVDEVFGRGDPAQAQNDAARLAAFCNCVLQYHADSFDAILAWNTLEYLAPPLVPWIVDRIHAILRPGGVLLVCFRAEGRDNLSVQHSFRIHDARTMIVQAKAMRPPAGVFTNRSIEKLFERFSSVKFFLSRDTVREVIVRK